jgi:hypothetical protein
MARKSASLSSLSDLAPGENPYLGNDPEILQRELTQHHRAVSRATHAIRLITAALEAQGANGQGR